MTQPPLTGHIAVWGAGKSGIAAARLLAVHGHQVTLYDDQPTSTMVERLGHEPFAISGGGLSFESHSLIVLSPGIPPHSPSLKALFDASVPYLSEIELALRFTDAPVVAITGTDGKSTTSAMIDHCLQAAGLKSILCGNFGIPVSDVVNTDEMIDVLVVEISAFQLWSTQSFKPVVAIITNIANDHLDYFDGSFEDYQASKLRIFRDLTDGLVVLRHEEWLAHGDCVPAGTRVTHFDARVLDAHWRYTGEQLMYDDTVIMSSQDLKVVGLHNINNALSAAAALHHLKIADDVIAAGLKTFAGLPHRMEHVREVDGVTFYNDSKATNPHAAQTGIDAMRGEQIIIAGGYDKGLELSHFAEALSRRKGCVLMGPAGRRLLELLPASESVVWVQTMEEAVRTAFGMADQGDLVVLSPGSSSFDAFTSFEHRGDEFKRLVRLL
ncbi:MAG: UDP-N-acetylmuramoyl-L-alanine--D-glutamate ligase [Bradymonadia bacterium]